MAVVEEWMEENEEEDQKKKRTRMRCREGGGGRVMKDEKKKKYHLVSQLSHTVASVANKDKTLQSTCALCVRWNDLRLESSLERLAVEEVLQ